MITSNLRGIVLDRIEHCRKTLSTELDLSDLNLDSIPKEVFELTWLESFTLGTDIFNIDQEKFIQEIPIDFSKLINLKKLSISNQLITNLSSLQKLINLEDINLADNKIIDLSPIRYLKNLKRIDISANLVSDLCALSMLNQLKALEFGYNRVKNLEPLCKLKNLMKIDCSANAIDDLSPLKDLDKLRILYCYSNNISDLTPILPIINRNKPLELVLHGNIISNTPDALLDGDCHKYLRNYYQALEQGFEWRRQLKIQFVGNGRVGKTSIAYALQHKKAAPTQMESTHGITIAEWTQRDNDDKPVTWQVWDFGGQEIYHATHRLFLSDDCLYLLVWTEEASDAEHETHHPVSYWQEAIHDLAPNSKVILVKNKIDQWHQHTHCPSELAEPLNPNNPVEQRVELSAYKYIGMNTLRGAIEDQISQLAPQLYLKLPTSWLAVEERLKQLKATQKTLSFDAFERLCEQQGMDYAEWFADYLHKTGLVFYQKEAFGNELILDQNWLIEAVYKIFDRKASYRDYLLQKGGRLTGLETQLIWSNTTETEREVYLGFMRNCHICHEANEKWDTPFDLRQYIIPALLPEQSLHQAAWQPSENDWLYTVNYPFLHRSIIERLIVRLGETYKDQSSPWRTGIYCVTESGQLLLTAQLDNKSISNQGALAVKLRGHKPDALLYALRKLIKEVSPHQRYTESLQKHAKDQPISLPTFKENDQMSSQLDQPLEKKPIQVFISYSKSDKEHRLELEKRVKLISRQFQTHAWTDAQLLAGGSVHEDIMEALIKADIVLLLISPDFIATDYCYDTELPKALELYKVQKNIVIPIIVRNTPDWSEQIINGFKLGDITALPTKGVPLSKWDDKDDFWADVQTGIKNRVKHMLDQA